MLDKVDVIVDAVKICREDKAILGVFGTGSLSRQAPSVQLSSHSKLFASLEGPVTAEVVDFPSGPPLIQLKKIYRGVEFFCLMSFPEVRE